MEVNEENRKRYKQKHEWQTRSKYRTKRRKTGGSGQADETAETRKKKENRHKLDVKGPLKHGQFFPLWSVFEKNKAHFFPERSKTKSIALPVHTYYFSKAPARRRKGRIFGSTGKDACRIGKMSFAGKSSVWLRQKYHSHRTSNNLENWRLCAHLRWNLTYLWINFCP